MTSRGRPSAPGGDGVPFGGVTWGDDTQLEQGTITEVKAHVTGEAGTVVQSRPYSQSVSFPAPLWSGVENVSNVSIELLTNPVYPVGGPPTQPPPGEFIVNVALSAQMQSATIMNMVTSINTAEPPPG